MAFSPLSRLDDWLIDHLFQPICDWICNTFGWSKKMPAAIFLLTSAASLVPYLMWLIEVREISLAPILLVYNAYQASKLFEKELKGEEESPGALSIHRLKERGTRKFTIVILPMFLALFFGISFLKGIPISLHGKSFLVWMITDLCALYFLACSDLPKPLKRGVTILSS